MIQTYGKGQPQEVSGDNKLLRSSQLSSNQEPPWHRRKLAPSVAEALAVTSGGWQDMLCHREMARAKENEVAEKAVGLLQHALASEQRCLRSTSDSRQRDRSRRRSQQRRSSIRHWDGWRRGREARGTRQRLSGVSQHRDRIRSKDDGHHESSPQSAKSQQHSSLGWLAPWS